MAGFDVTEGRRGSADRGRTAPRAQIAKLRTDGVKAKVVRDRRGRTAAQRQRARMSQATGADDSAYATSDPLRPTSATRPARSSHLEQYDRLLRQYPKIAEELVLGKTHQGRPIYRHEGHAATPTARKDGSPPGRALLRAASTRASGSPARPAAARCEYFVTNYGDNARVAPTPPGRPPAERQLVDVRAVVHLVATRTATTTRSRPATACGARTCADNDGDGVINEPYDGVDPNRNFADALGPTTTRARSNDPSSETYRGPARTPSPRPRRSKALVTRVDFALNKNDHTYGRAAAVAVGLPGSTPTRRTSRSSATLAGTRPQLVDPGRRGDLRPGSRVGALHHQRRRLNDHMYDEYGRSRFTPEGTGRASTGSGFVFQDVEADVQAEFERHVQFALDLARSADDPSDPESRLGRETPDFDVELVRPVLTAARRPVQVNAQPRRSAACRPALPHQQRPRAHRPDVRVAGGERYGRSGDNWYHRVRGKCLGPRPGDEVTVWFESRQRQARPLASPTR